MRVIAQSVLLLVFAGSVVHPGWAQMPAWGSVSTRPAASLPGSLQAPLQYRLRPGDVVQVKVYQEEDLTTVARISQDGAMALPLLGSVPIASNTVRQAATKIQTLLAKDFLVNPQVTVTVTEFAKRRFTVLGQVQHPGTYELPVDESLSLLQAIAVAGGYTRIGNPRRLTVQRVIGSQTRLIKLNADSMATNQEKPFEIQADDVIIVGEKWI